MDSNTKRKSIYTLLQKIGFKLPREHGLTAIGIVAVLLGICFSLTGEVEIIGLFMTLFFSVIVIFGSDSTMIAIKKKISSRNLFPIVMIIIAVVLIIAWKPIWHVIFVLFILVILTGVWGVSAFKSKRLSPSELVFGAVALSTLTSFIFVVASTEINQAYFKKVLGLNWVFIGVSILLILYVESLREKVNPYFPLGTWIVFLTSFLLLILLQVLPIISLIALIEPTFLGIYQGWKKELLKESKKPIKTVGIQLLVRLSLFTFLILLIIPFTFI
ncbi:MAG: hypothetical protein ACFE95_15235 [Candidatus Hodarchaeota archaeon]